MILFKKNKVFHLPIFNLNNLFRSAKRKKMEADPTLNVESEAVDFENEDQIEVRFTTKLSDPALQVEDTPFFVPLRLARQGLSEIINSLLELGTSAPHNLCDFAFPGAYPIQSLIYGTNLVVQIRPACSIF